MTSPMRAATIERMALGSVEHDLPTAQSSKDERATGDGTNDERTNVCPSCGRPDSAPRDRAKIAPFAFLMALARLAIAAGAALLLIAIVASLLSQRGFVSGEIWALFASFVLAIGVLLLYEIRDILLRHSSMSLAEKSQVEPAILASGQGIPGGVLRSIGALGSFAWLPLQSAEDRMLIGHLSAAEQHEFQNRLGILTLCMAGTTIAPVLVAFVFLSPVAVCIAATAIASNLFVLDWFKKRHKKWLYSTEFARRQGIKPKR